MSATTRRWVALLRAKWTALLFRFISKVPLRRGATVVLSGSSSFGTGVRAGLGVLSRGAGASSLLGAGLGAALGTGVGVGVGCGVFASGAGAPSVFGAAVVGALGVGVGVGCGVFASGAGVGDGFGAC